MVLELSKERPVCVKCAGGLSASKQLLWPLLLLIREYSMFHMYLPCTYSKLLNYYDNSHWKHELVLFD